MLVAANSIKDRSRIVLRILEEPCALFGFAVLTTCLVGVGFAQDVDPEVVQYTNDFAFCASSGQGAIGDVIPIEISLRIERLHGALEGYVCAGFYDSTALELLGDFVFSDSFVELSPLAGFNVIAGGDGHEMLFSIWGSIRSEMAERAWQGNESVSLGTLYFRASGTVSQETLIEFRDGFVPRPFARIDNSLLYMTREQHPRGGVITRTLVAHSENHSSGRVRFVEGAPTRTGVPDVPPVARVYDEPPDENSAMVHFSAVGETVSDTDRSARVEFFITSAYEWSGFVLAVAFPARYLELDSVEEHVRPGALSVDQEQGTLGLAIWNSTRRIGTEGERVKVLTATFVFNEPRTEIPSILNVNLERTPFHDNSVQIRHAGGFAADLPVAIEVAPISVAHGLVRVEEERIQLGDVNADFEVDLADVCDLLGYLTGASETLPCREAADFNGDTREDLSDAVAILNHLYLGVARPSPREIVCESF